jgi:hypothetical protein
VDGDESAGEGLTGVDSDESASELLLY